MQALTFLKTIPVSGGQRALFGGFLRTVLACLPGLGTMSLMRGGLPRFPKEKDHSHENRSSS